MKQVIVIRKDLNMRKGKFVAQGCHASLGAYLKASEQERQMWELHHNTKICVSVDSEAELVALYNKAQEMLPPCYLVTDLGLTEFNGQPTKTALAIGPCLADAVDKITGNLGLL